MNPVKFGLRLMHPSYAPKRSKRDLVLPLQQAFSASEFRSIVSMAFCISREKMSPYTLAIECEGRLFFPEDVKDETMKYAALFVLKENQNRQNFPFEELMAASKNIISDVNSAGGVIEYLNLNALSGDRSWVDLCVSVEELERALHQCGGDMKLIRENRETMSYDEDDDE